MLATPIQLASATATLSKFGQRRKPHIVFATQQPDESGLTPLQIATIPDAPIKDRQHWDIVIDAMREVVHGQWGTARKIGEDAQFEIAGKTGTAQVFGLKEEQKYNAEELEEKLRDHSLFVAFAPIEQVRVAVAIIVEHGGSGSAVAAPIARTILDAYLLGTEPALTEQPQPAS
jgi:penicillin-binding protein 2